MLSILREKSGSVVVKILFGAIAVSFISWGGVRIGRGCGSGAAIVVGPEAISQQEFDQRLREEFYFRRSYAPDITVDTLRQELSQRIVNRILLGFAAKSVGLLVSDDELAFSIRENPTLQDDHNRFDGSRYKRFLASRGLSVEQYEIDLRKELAIDKFIRLIKYTALSSDDDRRYRWEIDSQKIKLETVRVPSDQVVEISLTDDDISDYVAKNQDRVKSEYERDLPIRYKKDKQTRVSQIMVGLAETASEPDVEVAKKQIYLAVERIKTEPFETVAKDLSTDAASASRSGDMGLRSLASIRFAFGAEHGDEIFSANVGRVVGPFRSAKGFHLVKINETLPARTIPFDDAKRDIARQAIETQKRSEQARARAEALYAEFRAGRLTDAHLKSIGLGRERSKDFLKRPIRTAGGQNAYYLPGIGSDETGTLVRTAFGLTKNHPFPDGPVLLNNGYLLMKLIDRADPNPADYEKEKDALEKRALFDEQNSLLFRWLENSRKRYEAKTTISPETLLGPQQKSS